MTEAFYIRGAVVHDLITGSEVKARDELEITKGDIVTTYIETAQGWFAPVSSRPKHLRHVHENHWREPSQKPDDN